jgi:transposase-like protein
MTVSSNPNDESPQRLLQPAARAAALPAEYQPHGGAAPEALRAMIEAALQTALTQQFAQWLGAAAYERTARRRGVRNGTRARALVTRVGRVTLRVPRDRAALFTPAVFARYQRHEQALVALLAECYLQGVSTRKVRRVVETLCGETVSASLVSSATKRLDGALAAWRARRLEAQALPYLVVDAHYERIRREGQVLSTAVLWVLGVRADGYREYLGCWLGNAESAASWGAVCRDLAARGLHGVRYVVSDEHVGLTSAIRRYWPEAAHQRCQVHYLRNALTRVSTPARQEQLVAGLRDTWAAPTRAEALARGQRLARTFEASVPAVAEWLTATLEDTLSFYQLPEVEARRRLRTTNALEREHQEIRRRTRVIRVFPNAASFLRLATALAADRTDGWAKRRYLIPHPAPVPPNPVRRRRRAG